MNKQETVKIITLLAGNYENVSKKSTEEKQIMINTWYECLKDLDFNLILKSVKKQMIESPYMPTIHDIRRNAMELINVNKRRSSIEAWNEAFNMIKNGLYMTEEEFNQYSEDVKKFFGTVNQVKQLAMVDIETINTVVKGQFLRQYEALIERENKNNILPASMKKYTEQLIQNMNLIGN